MNNPVSTYRLQFNKDFTFKDTLRLIPYFEKLGVKTIYASPVFKAVEGSTHGYDVVNPYDINPEIGSLSELRDLTGKLAAAGIRWVQDIVPNHMAFHHSNLWLWDVLEKGGMSVYADYFDVTWAGDFFRGRLMAPFLGDSIDQVVERGELKIIVRNSKFCIEYGTQFYPLNSRTYGAVLEDHRDHENIGLLVSQLEELHRITDNVQYALRWHEVLLQLSSMLADMNSRAHIEKAVERLNADPSRVKAICEEQYYRLCKWTETDEQITYRRFFLVNGLICLNMQSSKVFDEYHDLIGRLVKDGTFSGLRVDHIDGLFDPQVYLSRLRDLVGPECYLVVEKILEPDERLETLWPVQGTTGYEFLSAVNNLFTRNAAEGKFNTFYTALAEDRKPIHEKIINKKAMILRKYMQGELSNVYRYFVDHVLDPHTDIPLEDVKAAIALFLVEMPVYRYYGNRFPLRKREADEVSKTLGRCRDRAPELKDAFDLLQRHILAESASETSPAAVIFYQRCMQFSGPLMAKGVEDTLMYTFNRFVAHNEVGDSPEVFGLTPSEFHQQMCDRQKFWPLSMNATSTHDTKRGEDARARLNVLADLTEEWLSLVTRWFSINEEKKADGAPDRNDEYLIYQTLVGVYPHRDEADFGDRIKQYLVKALREAKRHSDWSAPDEKYEEGVTSFVDRILAPESKFISTFLPFQRKISDYGIVNSLSQAILKFTCPGVPDTYQGTTGWDLSLVDPDNRRQVDYDQHIQWLDELTDPLKPVTVDKLWQERDDSRIKLWITYELLRARNLHTNVFEKGIYVPIEVEGRYAHHCMAFARRWERTWILVVVPMNISRISTIDLDLINIDWLDTAVVVPEDMPVNWANLLDRRKGKSISGRILISDLCQVVPFAVLVCETELTWRDAGVLLSVTSLPSSYGIGDVGPAARQFVEFLSKSNQRIWQVLPINPVDRDAAFSPYSSYSAMAGNMLLISVEDLCSDGLLDQADLEDFAVLNTTAVNYTHAESIRIDLLHRAFENFRRYRFSRTAFDHFSEEQSFWLNDFALYELIKEEYGNSDWSAWPDELRDRESSAVKQFEDNHRESLEFVKWMQFIFVQQWSALTKYCHAHNVRIMGDLPFYVSYRSADVWANRGVFSLDENGEMKSVAGVPPDYFSETGQLWGMPTYHWSNLKSDDYGWFVARIRRNLELFDTLRLDHFRAFVDYWEVPYGEATAINGQWVEGPREELFNVIRKEIGALPFIAEDLGEVNQEVFELRDDLKLPGMKVLQFAFGDGDGVSDHVPHLYDRNFIVYSGTHDNNTTRGWLRKDASDEVIKKMSLYFGKRITSGNVTDTIVRAAYASVAKTVIIPMQDLLNLGESARMNTPSTTKKNWVWKLRSEPDEDIATMLRQFTQTYGR